MSDIAIAICTRNRGIRAARLVSSLLRLDPRLPITVVDQSDDEEAAALRALADEPSVSYLRAPAHGLSAARNLALATCMAPVVAFVDDDCVVGEQFLRTVTEAMSCERVAVAFGDVLPPCAPRREQLIPERASSRRQLTRSVWRASAGWMGACMAVRREAWRTLGGFDELLGAGTRAGAGEELDFALRALLAGFHVADSDRMHVIHDAAHNRAEERELIGRYYRGTGVALTKLLRRHPAQFTALSARLALRWAFGSPIVAAAWNDGGRARRLAAFLEGLAIGARMPLERHTIRFKAAAENAC